MIYTITGPSGSGKTALVHRLVTLYQMHEAPDRQSLSGASCVLRGN